MPEQLVHFLVTFPVLFLFCFLFFNLQMKRKESRKVSSRAEGRKAHNKNLICLPGPAVTSIPWVIFRLQDSRAGSWAAGGHGCWHVSTGFHRHPSSTCQRSVLPASDGHDFALLGEKLLRTWVRKVTAMMAEQALSWQPAKEGPLGALSKVTRVALILGHATMDVTTSP